MNKTIIRITLASFLLLTVGAALAMADGSDAASEYDATSTITFDSNGGTGSVPAQKVLEGNRIELPASGFTKSGYYLSGWRIGSATGTHINAGSEYTVTGDVRLYAEWTADPSNFDSKAPSSVREGVAYGYTPYSDYNDTENNQVWTQFAVRFMYYASDSLYKCTVVRDSVPDWMTISVSNRYIVSFAGTCYVPGIYPVNIHLNIDGPAGFEENYYISWVVAVLPEHQGETFSLVFDTNGGSGSVASIESQYANGIVLPSDGMTRNGYTLVGWRLSVDGTEATFPLGSVYTIRSDIAAKAHWVADPNIVILDANGGVSTDYTAYIAQTDGVITLPSDGFGMSGYRLAGWYLESASSHIYAPGYMYTVSGPVTFKAYWVPDSATVSTVTFNSNGGYGTLSQIVETGKSIVLPDYGFSKSGMELAGWSRGSADGTPISCGSAVAVTGSVTYFAIWSESTSEITVSFDLNGGYGSLGSQTLERGSRVTKPSDPSRNAFVFTGWKQVGGSQWDFGNAAEYSMTLQAQWSQHFTTERSQMTVTITIVGGWTAYGTVIDWGDGSDSSGYDSVFAHTYSYDIMAKIVVKSINGSTVQGESAIHVKIGTGSSSGGNDSGNGDNDNDSNDDKDDKKDDGSQYLFYFLIAVAVLALVFAAGRFL